MPLELTQPWYLLGLLALPVLVWYYVRGLTDFARWQRVASLAARGLVVGLLVLALCGLTLIRPGHEQFVVFAIDESLSVGEQNKAIVDDFLTKATAAAGGNKYAFIRFGAEPGAIVADRSLASVINAKGTNIAAALEVSTAGIPPSYVPKIVVLSDGNQTAGDAIRAALRGGVPISTVPLLTSTEPEVQVSNVSVPAQVREGEPFNMEITIDSNHDDEGEITVYDKVGQISSQKFKVKKGENKFTLRPKAVSARSMEYTVRVTGFKDKLLDNNTAKALVYTNGKPRVLLVDSDMKQSKDLADALEQEGIKVDLRPTQGIPESLSDLQNYELIAFANVPATSMSTRQMNLVRTYVQELGGGLLMIGGDQSFGLGGYYKTTIEEILPVRSDFEKEKEKPSIAMVLVIDKSGSMGGQKMEMAKDAAKAAVELLGPRDKVGVIAFDGDLFWIADIQPAANKAQILDKISAIEAGGGTTMGPPMEAAFEALQQTQSKLKHVIVLTDGVSEPADFEGIATNMVQSKMTCSTVAVGDDCDFKLLENIAKIGNGRYYHSEDPANIPQIFAKETVTASKSAINEVPFTPIIQRSSAVLADLNIENVSPLFGYVTTRPKPTSEVILATDKGDPLLSWWRYGLGMSVAFTSDAKGRWAAEWVSQPLFGKFWAQVIRNAMRKSDAKGVFVQMTQKDGKATVTLDAVKIDGNYLNEATTALTVLEPQGGEKKLTMTQTAPGRYVGEFPIDKTGTYHVQMNQDAKGQQATQQSRGLVVNYDDELRIRPTDEKLLEAVAKVSGGTFKPEPEAVFAPDERTATRPLPLWPYLLMAAMLVFLADVALRRIDFDLVLGRAKPPMKMVMAKR
ncbi:VWA domain-containing protein [Limnoglobus roseus]|uniref:VWA domain-containing protein n=1 Tax=Limnoglobus roseus TaxID=2598579 RepID=A0A5C1ANY4_9BACT|nr:VWA domain-containing protein [Limnoglobus roseus]QEL19726.1 VWA domain-containing protein [Limnoglobus roseus]